ncbi:MAG: caspase family protein [Candidatus Electrothrix scaldis]|nr:MAG: caspase family protein [Candidatus Electrothrix sp. GW3-3]
MGKIYALSVGINDYSPTVGKLRGCLNDVEAVTAHVKDMFKDRLYLETLTDSDATRENIIKLFRSHLGKAGADDVVLFHYSGHGARCKAAKEFKRFYPDGWDEGLVCYDSRETGGFDLADKELAVLLAEVASNSPHIAVLLDCCHSGSATRSVGDFLGARPRVTHEIYDKRPLDSYLDGHYSKLLQQGESLVLPASQHILLAACERVQKAWEGQNHQGVFTQTLLEALAESGPDITYADLFMRVRTVVRRHADNQTPQFETYQRFNAYSGFLGSVATTSTRSYNVYFKDDAWKAECGALHGLPSDSDKMVEFALYRGDELIGHAETVQVGPQESVVELLDVAEVNPEEQLQARITSLPVPPLLIGLSGDEKGVKIVLDCFSSMDNRTFGFVFSTDLTVEYSYTLVAENDKLLLREGKNGRLLQGAEGYTFLAAEYLFSILQRIATWDRAVTLQNNSTRMDKGAVQFQLIEDGTDAPFTNDEITFDIIKEEDEWREITFKLRADNRTKQPLHFTVAYFSNDFGVQVLYNERIEPIDELFELIMEDDSLILDEEEGDQASHVFQLIVSTEQIDNFLLEQEGIKIGNFQSGSFKGLGKSKERKKYKNEWFTKTIRVNLVRQLDKVSKKDFIVVDQKVPVSSGQSVQPAAGRGVMRDGSRIAQPEMPPTRTAHRTTRSAGISSTANFKPQKITIKGHSSLTADVSLTGVQPGSRSTGSDSDFCRALERQGLELLNFSRGGKTRGGAESILELSDIKGDEVLAKDPLEIELDFGLAEEEYILPLTFDGEDILLAGDAEKDDEGKTLIHIDHIPEGIPDHRRSVGKALKLYFFKTYLKKDNVNLLRWVEFGKDGSVIRHKEGVADKVAAAQNIILLVHGIIGDTENIAQGMTQAQDGEGVSLDKKFDLVLAYDYENLNTNIEDTARKLKEQLHEVGLHGEDDKRLTLLVHSMGGLVSRWFIEQEGGNAVVDHLVMCGTPNAGSPFGKVDLARKLTSVLTTWAMNYFAAFAPFGAGLLTVLGRSKKVTPTLEQMNPSSEFIQKLNSGDDPGIPYTILAGDIRRYDDGHDKLMEKLVAKVGKGGLFDTLYHDAGHDIAVALASIQGVANARQPVPVKQVVDCHHMNYFVSEAGLRALGKVEW